MLLLFRCNLPLSHHRIHHAYLYYLPASKQASPTSKTKQLLFPHAVPSTSWYHIAHVWLQQPINTNMVEKSLPHFIDSPSPESKICSPCVYFFFCFFFSFVISPKPLFNHLPFLLSRYPNYLNFFSDGCI